MSGFGGGVFGGGGFGSGGANGFNSASGGGGGGGASSQPFGFGQPPRPTTQQQQQQQQQQPPADGGFSAFGVTNGNGGGAGTTAAPPLFGSGGNANPNPFGGRPPQPPPPQRSGFSFGSVVNAFGGASSTAGFGSAATPRPPQQSSSSSSFPFGGATGATTPFGTTSHDPSAAAAAVNLFASPNPATSNPFGTSHDPRPFGGAGPSSGGGGLGPSPFARPPRDTPFASPAATATGFGNRGDASRFETPTNHHHGDDHHMSATDTLPPFGGGDDDDAAMRASSPRPTRDPFASAAPSSDGDGGDGATRSDRLSRLNEEIEAKKRTLKEKQMRRRREKQESSSAAASAGTQPEVAPPPPKDAAATSLAERNAARFASNKPPSTTDVNQLPPELRGRALRLQREEERFNDDDDDDDDANVGGSGEPHRMSGSLVGACPHMCPDEELLRRQKENDVQVLEMLHESVHPKGFTLRNTAVKRFRRSAADYKLDIPSLVRPPAVLERVCGYLEEWVMERDRQGPDPRFAGGAVPSALDVYAFVWDRLRMVRKDFILQNYQADATHGGRCSAAAARVHERVARWHAAMEHQLSHEEDFVSFHSQQNVQELGQTMKTLNLFYDDTLGRSTAEEDDGDGGPRHGCRHRVVQGPVPVDYDGRTLDGDASDDRVVGGDGRRATRKEGAPDHGTAEPEMRALYILMTMDNDGGMEVLKYAGALCVQKPGVYRSRPVQLALDVYKAKKQNNYARFFAILRDPATPYLFACVMFQYVERVRKSAFRHMSGLYGVRVGDRDKYDEYPLKDLVHLLCFEDEDEARTACRHYNVTVKRVPSSTVKEGRLVVFWKRTPFRERTDPEKGTVLRLRPRKMVRTIESKAKGVTRLAVCRGDLDGEGATSSRPVAARPRPSPSLPSPPKVSRRATEIAEEARRRDEASRAREAEAAAAAEEAERRAREEAERERAEAAAREKAEAAAREEARRLRKEEEERAAARRKAEEEARRRAAEERRRAAVAAEAERQRIEEERRAEAARAAAAAEVERRRAEAVARAEEEARQAMLRAEEAARRRAEEERRRAEEKQQRAEEERRRAAEEAERRRLARLREEEMARAAAEWQKKIDLATKRLAWRRWCRRVESPALRRENTRRSLSRLDNTFSSPPRRRAVVDAAVSASLGSKRRRRRDRSAAVETAKEDFFYRLSQENANKIRLSRILTRCVAKKLTELSRGRRVDDAVVPVRPPMILFKLAVVVPRSRTDAVREGVLAWIHSRATFGAVEDDALVLGDRSLRARTVVVDGDADGADAVLFVVPPFAAVDDDDAPLADSLPIGASTSSLRAVLLLDDGAKDRAALDRTGALVSRALGDAVAPRRVVVAEATNARATDAALASCCAGLAADLVDASVRDGRWRPRRVVRVRASSLARRCVAEVLDRTRPSDGEVPSTVASVFRVSRAELEAAVVADADWPAQEFTTFLDDDGEPCVPDYFGEGSHLPSRRRTNIAASDADKIADLLSGAPDHVRRACDDHTTLAGALRTALLWRNDQDDDDDGGAFDKGDHLCLSPSGATRAIHDVLRRHVGDGDDEVLVRSAYDGTGSSSAPSSSSRRKRIRRRSSSPSPSPRRDAVDEVAHHQAKVSDDDDETDTSKKQKVDDDPVRRVFSAHRRRSSAFTKTLEDLLLGRSTVDVPIGSTRLANILASRNATLIQPPAPKD